MGQSTWDRMMNGVPRNTTPDNGVRAMRQRPTQQASNQQLLRQEVKPRLPRFPESIPSVEGKPAPGWMLPMFFATFAVVACSALWHAYMR